MNSDQWAYIYIYIYYFHHSYCSFPTQLLLYSSLDKFITSALVVWFAVAWLFDWILILCAKMVRWWALAGIPIPSEACLVAVAHLWCVSCSSWPQEAKACQLTRSTRCAWMNSEHLGFPETRSTIQIVLSRSRARARARRLQALIWGR
jgi:hypothetical protein